MSQRKEKLLKKYIEKKKKQRKRDDLIAQIMQLDENKETKIETKPIKHKNKKEVFQVEEKIKYFGENKSILESRRGNEFVLESRRGNESILESRRGNEFVLESRRGNESILESRRGNEFVLESRRGNESVVVEEDSSTTEKIVEEFYNESTSNEEHSTVEDFKYDNLEFKAIKRSEEIELERRRLPVYYEQSEIISIVLNNTVVVVKGATGSGKTTQIPQFLHERGFSTTGLICITQPRRISTIGICSRLNEELCQDLCGYKIRYDSYYKPSHHLVVMTDGVLLKEIQNDFLLSKYSVVVLDEIHERSVNMDILISLMAKIVQLRKENGNELKLILMSACDIDLKILDVFKKIESFTISSASHKLSIFYENENPKDLVLCALNCIKKILKKKTKEDILVFLPSKGEIYKLKNMIDDQLDEIALPLHGSLSKKEQSLVYKPFKKTKIVLSTNIAETSLTIPNIAFVIDTGFVKNKFVSPNGIVQYKTEFISKSSALQRAGRAGRTCSGIVYRLYTGELFNSFKDENIPKILYEPLDEVVLNLISLGISDILNFPFFCAPPENNLKLALANLKRLRYVDIDNKLTKSGEIVSKLPVHPNLARFFCLPNTSFILPHLVAIVSCLSVNFELKRIKENESYFVGEKSDIIVVLKIFLDYLKSNSKKEFCENLKINSSLLSEAYKLNKNLLKRFNLEEQVENLEKDKLREIVYKVYFENIALLNTDCYFCKGMNVYLSSSSITTEDEIVVFEYLTQGSQKIYMKNVTVVEKEWL